MAYQMLEFANQLPQMPSQQDMEIGNNFPNIEVSGNQLNQDFFQENKDIPKKKKKERKAKTVRKNKTLYSPTKIKARKFLSNIGYSRICQKEFSNVCFVEDALTYITMDLKPFFLSTTYHDLKDKEMIRMLLEECLPQGYYNYIKRPENFELPHSPKITFKQVKDLIGAYVQIPNAWTEIVNFFKEYHDIYQYIYAHLFPKTYVNRAGFRKKIQHKMCFERWQQKKKKKPRAREESF